MSTVPHSTRSESSRRWSAVALVLASLLSLFALAAAPAASAAPDEITHFALPYGTVPEGIATGADGNLWFAENGADRIGRITPGGEVSEFTLPTPEARPMQVTAGPDGNVWFAESRPGNVGRITPDGTVTEFPVCDYCRAWGITAGPEGDVWFTLPAAGEVGRITPSGQITRFPLSVGPNEPALIATGSDGNLWVADKGLVLEEPTIGQIVRLTPAGQSTLFKVPTPVENFRPTSIAPGPDGALWFGGSGTGIGRIDVTGKFTEFPVPRFGEVDTIVAGPDGNIWFSVSGPAPHDGSVDRLTPDGHLTTYPVPYGSRGIAVGPEGHIWFTEWANHGIGRITPGSPGIEIASSHATIRGRRAPISLFCSGGTPGTRCQGAAILRARFRSRDAGGHSTLRRVELGRAPYDIANGQEGSVSVRLRPRRLKRVPRGTEIEAVAVASAGVGGRRAFAVTLRGRR